MSKPELRTMIEKALDELLQQDLIRVSHIDEQGRQVYVATEVLVAESRQTRLASK